MADDNKQKSVETPSDATKPSTAKKAPAKKPASKKAPVTADTGAPSAEAVKKPAAKKPGSTKKTAEPKIAAKKKTETVKTADKPKTDKSKTDKPKVEKAKTAKAADKKVDVKPYEAPEARKSARGRVAQKVADADESADVPSELTSPQEKKKTTRAPRAEKTEDTTPPSPKPAAKKPAAKKLAPPKPTAQTSEIAATEVAVEEVDIEKIEVKQEVKEQIKEIEEKKESTPQELLDRGAVWLKELFVRMNLKAEVETREQDTDLLFNVSVTQDSPASQNLSARTLESIQTLLADVLSERGIGRVVVDIDGFLQTRDTELAEIATKLGKTARKVNGAITIAGFNSHERRVIHQSLESEKDLKTESTDVGAFRKLRILNQK